MQPSMGRPWSRTAKNKELFLISHSAAAAAAACCENFNTRVHGKHAGVQFAHHSSMLAGRSRGHYSLLSFLLGFHSTVFSS